MQMLILRYGELWLKSDQVKKRFLDRLAHNCRQMLEEDGIESQLKIARGRLFVETDDKKAIQTIQRIFGLVSVSPSKKIKLPELEAEVLSLAKKKLKKGMSFAMAVKRSGQHSFTSQELAGELGFKVVEKFGNKVNLTKPDLKISVEVWNHDAYVFTETFPCAGGLPLGVEGRVLALFDGSEESALAAYFVMRRGCDATMALTNKAKKSSDSIKTLKKYSPNLKFAGSDAKLDALCEKEKAKAIVSSQKFKGFKHLKSEYPVIYPLIGLKDKEIKSMWSQIKKSK